MTKSSPNRPTPQIKPLPGSTPLGLSDRTLKASGPSKKKATKRAPKKKAVLGPSPEQSKKDAGKLGPEPKPKKKSSRPKVFDTYSVGTFVRWCGIVKGLDFDQTAALLDKLKMRTLKDASIVWELKETRRPPADVSKAHEAELRKLCPAAFKKGGAK